MDSAGCGLCAAHVPGRVSGGAGAKGPRGGHALGPGLVLVPICQPLPLSAGCLEAGIDDKRTIRLLTYCQKTPVCHPCTAAALQALMAAPGEQTCLISTPPTLSWHESTHRGFSQEVQSSTRTLLLCWARLSTAGPGSCGGSGAAAAAAASLGSLPSELVSRAARTAL